MSKLVKQMIVKEYKKRFAGVNEALIVDIRLLDANANNALRRGLRGKNVRVTVLRNALAKSTFAGTGLAGLDPLISGPTALVYGGESVVNVARQIVEFAKKVKELALKGAILDGTLFSGKAGVEALAKYPTKEEARAQVVQLIISPGGALASALGEPGGAVAAAIKTIIDKLEKGDTIAKVG